MDIFAQVTNWGRGVELSITDGEYSASPFTMEKIDPAVILKPSCTLTIPQAQKLIDNLWDCGLRPSEGSGSAGSLKATQNHLADMQRLVFDGK